MRRLILFLQGFLFLPSLVWGQPPGITGPDTVPQHRLVRLAPPDTGGDSGYLWDIYPFGAADIDEDADGELVFTGPPGRYDVTLRVIDFGTQRIETYRKSVTIEGRLPPDPSPGPGPEPEPDPDPNPDPGPGAFRVLLIYESGPRNREENMTEGQRSAFYSHEVADYLNLKTAAGSDGIRSWRRWDKDVIVENAPSELKELWGQVSGSITDVPAVVIAKGAKVDIYPIPETEDELLNILKRHGGP